MNKILKRQLRKQSKIYTSQNGDSFHTLTKNNKNWCEIWGFHGTEDSSQGLLGLWCCVVLGQDTNLPVGSNKVFQNVGIIPQHYTASQPRRPQLESSPPWKPQISQV